MNLLPALRYPGLTVRQLIILLTVYQSNIPLYCRQISTKLDIPRPSVSRAWDALSIMNLMVRKRTNEDARNVYAVLTPLGIEFAKKVSE